MKIKTYTVIIALCVIFACAMTACGNGDSSVSTDTAFESITEAPLDTNPLDTNPVETEPLETEPAEELREPVENEKALGFIEYQYEKALEIIDWVENGSFATNSGNETVGEDGSVYFPIKDEVVRPELDGGSITSFAELSSYINSIFSRSIADSLTELAREHYTDIDGVLCLKLKAAETESEEESTVTEASEENPDSEAGTEEALTVSDIEFFLSKFTDTMFRYTAKVSYEASEQVDYFDFIFENTGGGWYWTSFPKLPE